MFHFFVPRILIFLAFASGFSGQNYACAQEVELASAESVQHEISAPATVDDASYILGAEDELNITVFGESNISGTYSIDGNGYISMPLINELKLSGIDLRAAEKLITQKLSDGYLIDPSVVIEVAAYRPFYILGEVRKPGRYAYASDMNVLKAAALAGGFTYRANRKSVDIQRGGMAAESGGENASLDTRISPGDIIMVKERFF